ncbi:MAG: cupin domain-containing protein [Bacteroidia bacterium]|nr:cupin domain-containing protein [Bacteroidia bacterium]
MLDIDKYIESGVIEDFCLGLLSDTETVDFLRYCKEYPELQAALEETETALEVFAGSYSVKPKSNVKEKLFSVLDNLEQEKNIDLQSPPQISRYSDPKLWATALKEVHAPDEYEGLYLHPLTEEGNTIMLVAFLKEVLPEESHDDMYESFMILEGTCTCYVGDDVIHLAPGDYLEIPLHVPHNIVVTSKTPVKAILQRIMIAA